MQDTEFTSSLDAMERQKSIFDQQLDHYSTGETVHLVANLKATYLLAIGLHRKGGYRDSSCVVRESEAEILAFLNGARSQMALFV